MEEHHDGLKIYDELSETYGIQDIICQFVKEDIRRFHALHIHKKCIREINHIIMVYKVWSDQGCVGSSFSKFTKCYIYYYSKFPIK